jgi:hypothetical protein
VGLVSCGGGNGNGGNGAQSGQGSLLLNAYGDPIDMGAPFYEFDFGSGEMLTGIFALGAGGDVAFMEEAVSIHYYFGTSESGGIMDMGTVELASVTEAPESGYLSSVDLGGAELDADWSLLVGCTFCVRTADGAHYAKMRIVGADKSMQTITFDWVYLPDGGRVFP